MRQIILLTATAAMALYAYRFLVRQIRRIQKKNLTPFTKPEERPEKTLIKDPLTGEYRLID